LSSKPDVELLGTYEKEQTRVFCFHCRSLPISRAADEWITRPETSFIDLMTSCSPMTALTMALSSKMEKEMTPLMDSLEEIALTFQTKQVELVV